MDLENKEETLQPLSEEEMEQAVGGEITLGWHEFLYCETCYLRYHEVPENFKCSRCGRLLSYRSTGLQSADQ